MEGINESADLAPPWHGPGSVRAEANRLPRVSHQAEAERPISLGARRRDLGGDAVPSIVLADPEGNEFCLLGSLDADA